MTKNFILRLIAALLATVFLILTATPVSAASTSAADMRLEAVEGTVSLTNSSGRSMSLRDGMKLYSGYTLSTAAASYAYISLDGDKAVKLDADSSLEVRKDGKKLELLLKSGKLLFDVKKPLKSGESMNIRTSTMVTGIRGTVGIVTANAYSSELILLEGIVEVTLTDGTQSAVIHAGQSAFCSPVDIKLAVPGVGSIPGFAAVELASDSALAERVELATGWDLSALASSAEETLERDELAATKAVSTPKPAKQIYMDLLPGSKIELPIIIPSSSDVTSAPPAPTEITLTAPVTLAELEGYFADYDSVTLSAPAGTTADFDLVTVNSGETLTIPAGKTLTVGEDVYYTDGGRYVSGRLVNNGTIVNNGTLINDSQYALVSDKSSTIENNGEIILSQGSVFENYGTLTLNSGSSLTSEDLYFHNYGYIEVKAGAALTTEFFNNTSPTADDTATVKVYGTAVFNDVVNNSSLFEVYSGGVVESNYASPLTPGNDSPAGFNNSTSDGQLNILEGARFVNNGHLLNLTSAWLNNEGTLVNNGTIYNGYSLEGSVDGGTIFNYGTLENYGAYAENSGIFYESYNGKDGTIIGNPINP